MLFLAVFLPNQAPLLALTNGGFETADFTGWSTIGTASIVDSTYGAGPVEGIYQALLTTADNPATAADLELFLSLAPGALDSLGNGISVEGAAIQQTLNVNAGDVLAFSWNFATLEDVAFDPNDFAFVTIGPLFELADVSTSLFIPSSTLDFPEETGFQTFSYVFPTAGSFLLGLGVVDEADGNLDSGLLLDQFSIAPAAAVNTIPESSSILMLAIGWIGMHAFRLFKCGHF